MRSGDAIIIRPSLTMNDVPMMLEKGWVHMVCRGEEFKIDEVRNAFMANTGYENLN